MNDARVTVVDGPKKTTDGRAFGEIGIVVGTRVNWLIGAMTLSLFATPVVAKDCGIIVVAAGWISTDGADNDDNLG